jgi:beta-N-acetylhexosaminidase
MRSALIVGLSGERLSEAEKRFLASSQPCGIILFARNCASSDQIRALLGEARDAIGADEVLVLIDQEGGRVRRLRPPQWRELPAAAAFALMRDSEPDRALALARLGAEVTAADLRAMGINTNCAPVLDLRIPGAHDIIGDRAYGTTPAEVAEMGRAVAEGYLAGGVVPVIKHIPGHGRALADSHFELPVVDASREELERNDFAPFRALADMPAAMTAHVVYTAVDPDNPASTSATATAEIIRGHIGFDGLLMSDDLGMKALAGAMRDRAEAVIRAGSDVALHCSGDLSEMEQAAAGVPALEGDALRRFEAAISHTHRRGALDIAAAEAALEEVARNAASTRFA